MRHTLRNERLGAAESPVHSTYAHRINKLVPWIARHWLAFFNSALALYLFLAILAPVLVKAGMTTPASIIYFAYSFMCHQLPENSYFLFGEQPYYSLASLEAVGLESGLDLFQRRAFRGNEVSGYKIAMGQRLVAIYGSVLLSGLAFGLVRSKMRASNLKIFLLFSFPMALDGFTQLVGLRESNWWLRTVTGALFGGSSVWLAYPYLESAMRDVVQSETMRSLQAR